MPGLNGLEFAKELTNVKYNTNKVFNISLISADYVVEAEQYVDNQFEKPLRLRELYTGRHFAQLKFLKTVKYFTNLDEEEL